MTEGFRVWPEQISRVAGLFEEAAEELREATRALEQDCGLSIDTAFGSYPESTAAGHEYDKYLATMLTVASDCQQSVGRVAEGLYANSRAYQRINSEVSEVFNDIITGLGG